MFFEKEFNLTLKALKMTARWLIKKTICGLSCYNKKLLEILKHLHTVFSDSPF